MFEQLKKLDKEILLFINSYHNSFFDSVMWFASDKTSWVPLYIFLCILLIWKYKQLAWLMVLLIIPLIVASDMFTSEILKPLTGRLRPSHHPGLENLLHYVNNYRGGLYSFPSSHAANTFALITYLCLITAKKIQWLPYLLIPFAVLVSYSRMYLGVHYPSDVLVGTIIGVLLGWIFYKIYFRLSNSLKKQ
jgi:undecaprenyl-diphosphatase